MNNKLNILFQSIYTIHQIETEAKNWFYWILHPGQAIQSYRLKLSIKEQIETLYDDKWTIQYLKDLEKNILAFYDQMEKYMGNELYLSDRPPEEVGLFIPIYFIDGRNQNHLILLDIVSNNITFRIIDTSTGNSFAVSSINEVQNSQMKISYVCKNALVQMMLRYLNNDWRIKDV